MYPNYADLLSELQKLTPEQLQQTVTVYDDVEDEFRPVVFYKNGRSVNFTDHSCDNRFDHGQAYITI